MGIIEAAQSSATTPSQPPGLPTPDQLNTMPWGQIIGLRNANSQNQSAQDYLAPFEHQAYARETAEASPILGSVQMALMTPLYSGAKALGIMDGAKMLGLIEDDGTKQSGASWDEVMAGFKGIGQGISNVVGGWVN